MDDSKCPTTIWSDLIYDSNEIRSALDMLYISYEPQKMQIINHFSKALKQVLRNSPLQLKKTVKALFLNTGPKTSIEKVIDFKCIVC